jgi:hypothetical protein
MTQSDPFGDLSNGAIADLVAELRSRQGCATKRLSRGGHEFVLAKHTRDTDTDLTSALELIWVAGPIDVTAAHVEKLRTTAHSIDAGKARVVTVGDGDVIPQLGEDLGSWSEPDLRTLLETEEVVESPSGGSPSPSDAETNSRADTTGETDTQPLETTVTDRWNGTTTYDGGRPRTVSGWSGTTVSIEKMTVPLDGEWKGWTGSTVGR